MADIQLVVSIERREMIDDLEKEREENLHLTVQRDMLLLLVAVLSVVIWALA